MKFNMTILNIEMLYIRHAQKAYRNGGAVDYCLDPGLTDEGKDSARKKFQDYLFKYGVPNKIISSPFLRARETAQIAADVIMDQTGITVPLFCDVTIGEYLGHQCGKKLDDCVTPETMQYQPIPPEGWEQYKNRVKCHVRCSKRENCWIISHGLVIQTVASIFGTKVRRPSELHGIRVVDQTISVV